MNRILEFLAGNPMAIVIGAGEIGFWVLIAAGLLARYVLRMRRTSTVLLAATPVVDLGVLIAAMIDLSAGGQANGVHGLAAVYLGFSVAFGPRMIRWADARFAYRFAGGPPPTGSPKYGRDKVRHEWREWGRCVLGCSVASAVLLILVLVTGSPEQTRPLWTSGGWLPRLGVIATVWLAVGPLRVTLFPPRSAESVGARS